MKKYIKCIVAFILYFIIYWWNYIPLQTNLPTGQYSLISLKREYNYITGYYWHARVVLIGQNKYNSEKVNEIDLSYKTYIAEANYRKTIDFRSDDGWIYIYLNDASFIKD